MSEKFEPLQTVRVTYACDACLDGGALVFQRDTLGAEFLSVLDVPSYAHKCDKCGYTVRLEKKYPRTEHRVLNPLVMPTQEGHLDKLLKDHAHKVPVSTGSTRAPDDGKPPHCNSHKQFEYDCLDCADAAGERIAQKYRGVARFKDGPWAPPSNPINLMTHTHSRVMPTAQIPQIPWYRHHDDHKKAQIARIVGVDLHRYRIELEIPCNLGGTDRNWISVGPDYCYRHKPGLGGYYVRYADGNESYSLAKAFKAGYSRIDEPAPAKSDAEATDTLEKVCQRLSEMGDELPPQQSFEFQGTSRGGREVHVEITFPPTAQAKAK